MNKEDLEKYEAALQARRDELSREMKGVIQGSDMGAETQPEEESDEDEERGIAYAEQIALKEQLTAVLDALEKIKSGAYGACEKCRGPIERALLDAMPESRYCKQCKTSK
jgi:DnaK suppressor protein